MVSKWELFSTTFARSGDVAEQDVLGGAARCVGIRCSKPVMSRTAASNRYKEAVPVYDSSLAIMPAHCRDDMAPVPLSVSRSINTCSALSRKWIVACLREQRFDAPSVWVKRIGLDRAHAERFDDGLWVEVVQGHQNLMSA